jgi:hypothetical protein
MHVFLSLGRRRRANARLAAEEHRYTRALVEEHRKADKQSAEEHKAFEGVKGIGQEERGAVAKDRLTQLAGAMSRWTRVSARRSRATPLSS